MLNLCEESGTVITKGSAVARLKEISEEAIEAVRVGLNCDGEIVFTIDSSYNYVGACLHNRTGNIDKISDLLFHNAKIGKITRGYGLTVSVKYGQLSVTYRSGKTRKVWGDAVYGQEFVPVSEDMFEEIRNLLMTDAVPKIIKSANAIYAFYKKKYLGGKES